MANTLLSQLGGSIFVDGYDGETIITLLADGTAKAGWIVGQSAGAVSARGTDVDGNLDETMGILKERYDTDIDTAPTANELVEVVIPKSGRRYRVLMIDQNGALNPGEPMTFSNTAGAVTAGANIEAEHCGRLNKAIADDDLWCELIWGV